MYILMYYMPSCKTFIPMLTGDNFPKNIFFIQEIISFFNLHILLTYNVNNTSNCPRLAKQQSDGSNNEPVLNLP